MNVNQQRNADVSVLMTVNLYQATLEACQYFESAMKSLHWVPALGRPNAYLTTVRCAFDIDDSEIVGACQHDLALAASEAQIIDFEGTVILGVSESDWRALSNAG